MAHTLTAGLAVTAVLLLLVGRRCTGGAAHRSCARRRSARRDALTGTGFSIFDSTAPQGGISPGLFTGDLSGGDGGCSSGSGHSGGAC